MTEPTSVLEPQELPGMEGTRNVLDEAQIKSARARAIFEWQEGAAPWMDDYWALIDEGWTWRQAVYMLWTSLPRDARTPKTQHELATQVLDLNSDRVIRKWKQNPALDARVAQLVSRALAHARPEIYAALVKSASNPNPRAHSDRRLALEMLGDYTPRQRVALGLDQPADLEELSDADLARLKELPDGDCD